MRVLRLLRQPVPLAVWLGQLFSVTGDKLYAMAVLWLVLQLTGSARLMAAVSAAESVPYVLAGLLGAGLIARSARLRAMVRLDLLSAAVIGLIPVSYLLGGRSILLLVAVAAAASALQALFGPALQSALPDLVCATDLQPMVALTDSTDRLGRVLGPGGAGLLLLVVPEIHLFSLDAGTFVVSAAALAFVARRTRCAPAITAPGPAGGGLRDGLREVRRLRSLRLGLALRGWCNLAWPAFTIGLPFDLVHRLNSGLAGYGFLLGIFGAGNLAGNLLSGNRRIGGHLLAVYCLSWSAVGAGFLALALAPSLPLAALATAWTGIFTPLANVSMDAHIAVVVPRHRLPRVYALQRVTVTAAGAAGAFAVAAGIGVLPAAAVIAAAGAWMLLAGLFAAARSRSAVRDCPDEDDRSPAEEDAMSPRPPLPPFTEETARQKVQAAEDAWNTREPERVAGAYTVDSVWRNRHEFITGRDEIVEFLRRKWSRELDYALRKNLWSCHGNRIAVRFQYESHDAAGQWYRSYGNELWEFDEDGLMRRREASINDVPIDASQRRIFGPRPEPERGQSFPLH